jgi:hypothetical protein
MSPEKLVQECSFAKIVGSLFLQNENTEKYEKYGGKEKHKIPKPGREMCVGRLKRSVVNKDGK